MNNETINELIAHYDNIIDEMISDFKVFDIHEMSDQSRLIKHVRIHDAYLQIEKLKSQLRIK